MMKAGTLGSCPTGTPGFMAPVRRALVAGANSRPSHCLHRVAGSKANPAPLLPQIRYVRLRRYCLLSVHPDINSTAGHKTLSDSGKISVGDSRLGETVR